jgi:hypothetical protein
MKNAVSAGAGAAVTPRPGDDTRGLLFQYIHLINRMLLEYYELTPRMTYTSSSYAPCCVLLLQTIHSSLLLPLHHAITLSTLHWQGNAPHPCIPALSLSFHFPTSASL